MTLQEAFNINWQHFVVEKGKPSLSPFDDACLYHSDDGGKCAIGVLLPNDVHQRIDDLGLNSDPVESLCSELPQVDQLLNGIPLDVLGELQATHDNAALYADNFSAQISKSLERFAAKHNLVIPSEVHA